MRNALRAAAGMGVLLVLGCINGPYNGTTHSGSVINVPFTVSGYHISPNAQVEVQVLSSPTADPSVSANWTTIGIATSNATGSDYHGDILYPWSTSVVPVPNVLYAARWPVGGLVKIRALAHGSGTSTQAGYVFDDVSWSDCATSEFLSGTPGQSIGINCQGLGRTVLSMVSTSNNPADLGTRDFLNIKGDISTTETNAYYSQWGAPSTLAGFKSTFAYPGTGDVTATYYNDGDLGVGREMHCWTYTRVVQLIIRAGTACYVTNYSDTAGTPKFGNNNVTAALNNAINHTGGFATVAMVTEGILGGAKEDVNFVVYNASGSRVTTAQLDNLGAHRSVPNNCLTCHGVDTFYDSSSNGFIGRARFLPFDLPTFKYGTGSFSRLSQEEAFRKLNNMIRTTTEPTAAINEVLVGAYQANGGISNAGSTWDDEWMPADWSVGSYRDYATLYRGVVQPYCRTCHQTSSGSRDFADGADFDALINGIRTRACQSADAFLFMPHAEHPMRKFWASGARAYLNAWTGDTTGCKP
jgi:hypothetical protein